MKILKLVFFFFYMSLALLQACKEDIHTPVNQETKAPASLIDPKVENLPGAAKISYNLPEDKSLLYVKAVYQIKPGVIKEAKSSYYSSSLLVDGFGDTQEHEVKLYSVGRNDKLSDPVTVKVNPLIPPVLDAFNSVAIKEDWGGISFTFMNNSEANLAIEVLTKDSLDNWVSAETFYTKMKTGKFAVRGYESVKRMFGISIRDRWNNRSDTISGEYLPWYEVLLDKSKFKKVTLPTDYNLGYGGNNLENIWNNKFGIPDYVSTPGYGLPQWFTFDLGVTAKLSRIRVHLRTATGYLYNSGAVKTWELWGSNNPNPDGSWDSWTLLRKCQSIKPSGLPAGQVTNEDLVYATAGEEFSFENIPNVRYIRWKTLANWGGVTHANLDEIYVYGQPVK